MTTPRPCMCYLRGCLYFWGKTGPLFDPVYQCRAFPLGIPEDIVTGVNPHSLPEAGQEGDFTYSPGGIYPSWAKDLGPIEKGGPTSGNWGHAGRPGVRGGSAPGGGHAFFPVLDRHKMGGHSEEDLLGMVTMRRREMGTKHPGVELGKVAPGWEGSKILFRLENAKEDAKASAQRARWAQEDRAKAKRQEELKRGEDNGENARKRIAALEAKHQPGIDRMKTEYDAAYDESRAERKKLREMSQRAHRTVRNEEGTYIRREFYDAPADGVSQEAWEAQVAKSTAASAKSTELVKPLIKAREAYAHEVRETLTVKDPMSIDYKYRARWKKSDPSSMARKESWDAGRLGFENLVSTDLQPDQMHVEFRKGGRGRSSQAGKEIRLSKGCGAATVVHELGHRLEETNVVVRRSATAFLDYRTAGEKSKSLRSITSLSYRSGERSKTDKFMDPYMGKRYSFGGTEIISMGLDYMYGKPVEFAKGDPGYFDMIYNLARGVEWTPPAKG